MAKTKHKRRCFRQHWWVCFLIEALSNFIEWNTAQKGRPRYMTFGLLPCVREGKEVKIAWIAVSNKMIMSENDKRQGWYTLHECLYNVEFMAMDLGEGHWAMMWLSSCSFARNDCPALKALFGFGENKKQAAVKMPRWNEKSKHNRHKIHLNRPTPGQGFNGPTTYVCRAYFLRAKWKANSYKTLTFHDFADTRQEVL